MIRNIQALRFLAAFAVVGYHAGSLYFALGKSDWLAPLFAPLVAYGMTGVDLFFVISGYVVQITTAGRGGPAAAASFMLRRSARIYLGYWPWLLAAWLVGRFVTGIDYGDYSAVRSIALTIFIRGQLVMIVSWTLMFELMFYFAFAVAMLLPRRIGLVLLAAWAVASLVWPGRWWLSPFIAEFAAGAILAAAIGRFGPPPAWPAAVVTALLAAIGLYVGTRYGLLGRPDVFGRVLCVAPFAVATVALAVALEHRGIACGRWLVLLGDSSYALYLCHVPVLMLVTQVWWPTVHAHPDILYPVIMAATVVVAVTWYLAVERHLTAASSGFVRRLVRDR